jgi:two-component system alkaline phosphatase synthesis response regulator PhoP
MEMAQKKILVVDDDEDCRTFLRSVLEDEGFQVITASDGHEAVEKADAEFPDLVILDVMMETYTAGSNVVARLRESRHTKDIPIILSTALELGGADSESPDAEKPMQAQDYIRKPVDPERLIKSVKNLVGE